MKPRFELDQAPPARPDAEPCLIDPEAYDASEQQFSASLEDAPVQPKPRFVVDEEGASQAAEEANATNSAGSQYGSVPDTAASSTGGPSERVPPVEMQSAPERADGAQRSTVSATVAAPLDPDSWRQEVQAKVSRYRAHKRPRAPRYPSLQLKFESPELSGNNEVETGRSAAAVLPGALALAARNTAPPLGLEPAQREPVEQPDEPGQGEAGGKILEFPRSSASPVPVFDELAEPVFDRPRILEVPEVQPPPPALGGILIEPAEQPATQRRPGFELPLQAAPMPRRILAVAVDGLLVAIAVVLFACTFFRITSTVPPLRQIVTGSAALLAVFWAGYQYLLIVYAGTTPGLKLARLRLSCFDGNPVSQKTRRWRVLASWLSGVSLVLGYAWCFLDEDQLCWHDRITHTYIAPDSPK
jgi:uncharacterized RDD family membrane protein YckC